MSIIIAMLITGCGSPADTGITERSAGETTSTTEIGKAENGSVPETKIQSGNVVTHKATDSAGKVAGGLQVSEKQMSSQQSAETTVKPQASTTKPPVTQSTTKKSVVTQPTMKKPVATQPSITKPTTKPAEQQTACKHTSYRAEARYTEKQVTVVDQEAWTERIPAWTEEETVVKHYTKCGCGQLFDSREAWRAHEASFLDVGDFSHPSNCTGVDVEEKTGKVIKHPEEIIKHPAVTHTETQKVKIGEDGYCTKCGAYLGFKKI